MRRFEVAGRESEAVKLAVRILEGGGIIAVPTDTVYGIACDVQNDEALKKLYKIKTRDVNKPVAICLGRVEDIKWWGAAKLLPSGLLDDLLPGPVTIVLERTDLLNPTLNPFTDKVAVRVPDCVLVCDIAKELGRPLALTSANISSRPSTLSPEEFMPIWPQLSVVFDGGKLGNSLLERAGSTVINLSIKGEFSVIREGSAINSTVEKLVKHGLKLSTLI